MTRVVEQLTLGGGSVPVDVRRRRLGVLLVGVACTLPHLEWRELDALVEHDPIERDAPTAVEPPQGPYEVWALTDDGAQRILAAVSHAATQTTRPRRARRTVRCP